MSLIANIFSWSAAFSIPLCLGYLAYLIATTPSTSVNIRRYMLGIILIGSLIISAMPVLHIHLNVSRALGVTLPNIVITPGADSGIEAESPSFRFIDFIYAAYALGLAVMTIRLIISMLTILWVKLKSRKATWDGTPLYVHPLNRLSPFSFMGAIFISEKAFASADIELVIWHERAHGLRRHWVETSLMEILLVLDFYNPAIWRLRDRLRDLHEYEADRDVLRRGVNAQRYQLMLIKMAVGDRFQALADSLNHSSLKKRITMMQNQKSSRRGAWMRPLVLVPALSLALMVVSPSIVSQANPSELPGKITQNPSESQADEKVYDAAQTMPRFKGGEMEMYKFLMENMRYPESAKEKNLSGRVVVRFVVGSDGKVRDAVVIRSVAPELDKEALRVIGEMPPFTPGKIDGKNVAVHYTLPINFKIPNPAPKTNTPK